MHALGEGRSGRWSTVVYLKTNIAKYLPGNVWHFLGRVRALKTTGADTGTAVVGVVLEPLLMAAAALSLAALSFGLTAVQDWRVLVLCLAAGGAILAGLHPQILNPLLRTLGAAKARAQGLTVATDSLRLRRYPWAALLGEIGFVLLRGLGFVLAVVALRPLTPGQVLAVLGAFSVAWLLGLVVPGAPGGIGVFEAAAIALLEGQLPGGLILSSVAFYRLLSTLAEALGAALVWLDEGLLALGKPPERLGLPVATEDAAVDEPG